jgi:chromosome segregation ATPase
LKLLESRATPTVLERLRRLVAPPPLETTYDDAPAAFTDYHADRLREAREQADQIRTDIATAVVALESGLESLESYEDERDRVEDVVSNVAIKRRSQLENLSLSDDPAELGDAVETFLQDRSDLSQKEAAIVRQIELPTDYQEAVEEFKEAVQRLDQFLDNEYELLETLETLEALVDKRRDQLGRIEDLEAEIADLDPESIEDQLHTKRAELDDLKESALREEYHDLEKQLDAIETERQEILSDIGSAAAECRRSLRKLIYAIENDGVDIEADLAVLKELRDGETAALLERDPEHVSAVAETVAAEVTADHLDDSERASLLDGLAALQKFPDQANRVEELEQEYTRLEDRLQTHEFQQRKQEFKNTIERLEAELDTIQAERDRLEDQLSAPRESLSETENRIEEVLIEQISGDVTIE